MRGIDSDWPLGNLGTRVIEVRKPLLSARFVAVGDSEDE
jgi:hypothetical protein